MQLNGQLQTLPLPDLAQIIGTGRKTGTLVITPTGEPAAAPVRLVFREGGLLATLREPGSRGDEELGRILLEEGLLSRSELEAVMAIAHRREQSLASTLARTGLLRPADLQRALDELTRRVFGEVMRWREGDFDFRESSDDELAIETAPRRIDELLLQSLG